MLTPPYHFSLVSSPPIPISSENGNGSTPTAPAPTEILCRGSVPSPRNLSFVRRLNLKTLVVLRKKKLKEDDPLLGWTKKMGVEARWFKAEEMGEEKLGMGKNEVGEVLKLILDPKAYPLYIADIDGVSHTTLVVACLRKLQGWHMDSIVNEICRFEPDHDDLPLVPFINSYLAPPSNSSSSSSSSTLDPPLVLPSPPYPSWLWPTPTPPTSSLTQSAQSSGSPLTSVAFSQPQSSGQRQTRERGATQSNVNSNSTPNTGYGTLPFPNPLSARKHPSMRLTFPPLPAPPSNASSSSSPVLAPHSNASSGPSLGIGGPGLSRTTSRREKQSLPPPATSQPQPQPQPQSQSQGPGNSSSISPESTSSPVDKEGVGVLGQVVGAIPGLKGISRVLTDEKDSRNRDEAPNSIRDGAMDTQPAVASGTSMGTISDQVGSVSSTAGKGDPPERSDSNATSLPADDGTTSTPSQPAVTYQAQRPAASSSSTAGSGVSSGTGIKGKSVSSKTNSPTKMNQVLTISSFDDNEHEDGMSEMESPSASASGSDAGPQVAAPGPEVEVEYEQADGDEYEDDEEEDEEEDDEDEDEDDEDEDEDDIQPTSQYISALDLAGFG